MLILALFSFILISPHSEAQIQNKTDWQQPGIGCVEDLYLHPLNETCPDLRNTSIGPTDLSSDAHGICAAQEVVRRETLKPGLFPHDLSLMAWLIVHSIQNRDEKIQAIYKASESAGMPPQMLYGILELESKVTDLGIIVDSENYSCGTGSLNLTQWCEWISAQDLETQKAAGWSSQIQCEEKFVAPSLVGAVFHQVFDDQSPWITQMDSSRYAKVSDEAILTALQKMHPKASLVTRKTQLSAIRSFTNHCSDPKYAIPATASSIKKIFDTLVPDFLKTQQRFLPGQSPALSCQRSYQSEYYPMHPGWMLAYAVHNMGDEAVDIFSHYYRNTLKKNPLREFNAQDVVDGLYWGGKLSTPDGKTYFTHYLDSELQPQTIDFNWPCIAHSNVFNVADRMMSHAPNPIHRDIQGNCRAIEARIQSSGMDSPTHHRR